MLKSGTRLGAWLLLAALAGGAAPQPSGPARAARQWRLRHERAILDEFIQLLSVPNVAGDLADMQRNAALIRRMLEKRGVRTRLLEVPGAPAAVFGELATPGARRTVLLYAHYDGQPVEPAQWAGGDPFRPELRTGPLEAGGKAIPLPEPGRRFDPEWRLYARSAGDDKAPIVALVAALDALGAAGVRPTSNIKVFFDGEEEAGSPHLEQIIRQHRELLAADAWIFCDGPVHQNRRQQVVFGARGTAGLQVTVYGPRRELHSGHYGNWAPNPALMLAHLLASLRDEDGRTLVRDFYEGIEPLSETEKRALAQAPDFDAELKKELWLARTEGGGRRLDELINLPALNVRGLASAGVGAQSRNVIPASATASIEVRLVKGMDHRVTVDRVIEHIRRQGYYVTEAEPDASVRLAHPKVARVTRRAGYNAVRTSMDLEISRRVIDAIEAAHGPVIRLPTLGGSLPIFPIAEILKAPAIVVPIANHDNNQHGHNENIRLQNLWDGIETLAALLAMR